MRSLDRLFKSRLNGTGLKPLVQYIKDLFSNNEQGVWYDPSDLTTLYQDAAGTIPVTAVEQPVGLMLDKSKGLVLGAELATSGLDFNTWQKTPAVTSVGVGTFTTSGEGGIYQWVSGVKNIAHYQVRVVGSTPVSMTIRNSNGTSGAHTVSPGAFDVTLRSQLFAEGEAIYFLANGAGTVNITSLSIRELPGNHATQTTTTSRPVLSARLNLLTKTSDGTDYVWVKRSGTTVVGKKVISGTSGGYQGIDRAIPVTAGVRYLTTVKVKPAEYSNVVVSDGAYSSFAVVVNCVTKQVVYSTGAGFVSAEVKEISGGVLQVSVISKFTRAVYSARFSGTTDNTSLSAGSYFAGDGVSGIELWDFDVRPANPGTNLPDYQRVNTATDYDTAGFPYYLKFDGTDDWLVTPSIDFTGTDKVSLFAGIRKLSDAAAGTVAELSANSGVTPNTFALFAPGEVAPTYAFRSSGTLDSVATATTFTSPITNVLTGLGDIAGDSTILRANGVLAASSTVDQGPGNFGNSPLYIGRRGGTSLPFNGHLYGLIIRGAATGDSQIKSVERYVNTKTRTYTA